MDSKTPLKISSFITESERREIASWVNNEHQNERLCFWNTGFYLGGYKFNDPDNQVWDGKLKVLENIPQSFFDIYDRISTLFEKKTLTKGNTAFVNFFDAGGRIQKHNDSHVENHWHVRCNVLIVKPEEGTLKIEEDEHDQDEKELVCFLADKYEHEVTKIKGKRIVLSYAMVVPKECFD